MSKVRNVEERGNRLGRTLSSRLANRDNRVSPCSHCVQRLPAIYKPHTVVRRKEREREREKKRESFPVGRFSKQQVQERGKRRRHGIVWLP